MNLPSSSTQLNRSDKFMIFVVLFGAALLIYLLLHSWDSFSVSRRVQLSTGILVVCIVVPWLIRNRSRQQARDSGPPGPSR